MSQRNQMWKGITEHTFANRSFCSAATQTPSSEGGIMSEDNVLGFPGVKLPPTTRRLVKAYEAIEAEPPEQIDYLHTVLCQVGMPRKAVQGPTFARECGTVSLLLQAGQLRLRGEWVDQPLPYGTKPRLILIQVCSQAVRKKSRVVKIGRSMREFMGWMGLEATGGAHGSVTGFKKQLQALAACRMTLGMVRGGLDVTVKGVEPIERFEAWTAADDQAWPETLELSARFYETLIEVAVPLHPRAIAALSHSALALDVYTWLAHRLHRAKPGTMVSWENLRDQFGQEYSDPKDFKKKFRRALMAVRAVYPDAKVEETAGGLLLHPSRPPISKTLIQGGAPTAPKEK